ncbi:hypothetical protein M9H77_30180 [Catharanthus roseus]|uniref:Uncharacterized protein n=1 Tax=Catharanthus roseus TaxID=4058 RepID=A0ACB9ZWI5_CATRO|nr:hypothetical protein M9H77_30180 [Catharanthus roseus]
MTLEILQFVFMFFISSNLHHQGKPQEGSRNLGAKDLQRKLGREYDEYHEYYDRAVHTYERYNLGVYGGNVFNGSYGDEPKVERRIMDSDDIVDECSKEKDNDLEKNERIKEMNEEKCENTKEELSFHIKVLMEERRLVTLRWHLCVYSVDKSSLNFFLYAIFAFRKPFKEEMQRYGFEDESFQMRGRWYDLGFTRNRRMMQGPIRGSITFLFPRV